MAQFVDIEAAKEFMQEALGKISPEELDRICSDLEKKSQFFQEKLNASSLSKLTEEEWFAVLRMIFATRRKAKRIVKIHSSENIKESLLELLHSEAAVETRIDRFCGVLKGVDETAQHDFASELLHFTFPDQYWLWTRWIWDPKNKTGALPLVITEDYDLEGSGMGATYLKIGKASAFIRHVGEAVGFQVISNGRFGVDAYLCAVYVVYVYTVLRMRMTQEFNQIVPGLAEFSRRLLGINQLEEKIYAG